MSAHPIQQDIEARLASAQPEVEVLLAEVVGDTVRVFIDHPDGVSLALCEQVTRDLAELREQYALEVSSPGTRRPLTKPDHFRRYLGRRATVRTRERQDDRRSYTGELVGASDDEVTIAADTGVVTVAYADIHRSNLIEE
jgi:ribosome maturation factor RimP